MGSSPVSFCDVGCSPASLTPLHAPSPPQPSCAFPSPPRDAPPLPLGLCSPHPDLIMPLGKCPQALVAPRPTVLCLQEREPGGLPCVLSGPLGIRVSAECGVVWGLARDSALFTDYLASLGTWGWTWRGGAGLCLPPAGLPGFVGAPGHDAQVPKSEVPPSSPKAPWWSVSVLSEPRPRSVVLGRVSPMWWAPDPGPGTPAPGGGLSPQGFSGWDPLAPPLLGTLAADPAWSSSAPGGTLACFLTHPRWGRTTPGKRVTLGHALQEPGPGWSP